MEDHQKAALRIVNEHIDVWRQDARFRQLAAVLQKERVEAARGVCEMLQEAERLAEDKTKRIAEGKFERLEETKIDRTAGSEVQQRRVSQGNRDKIRSFLLRFALDGLKVEFEPAHFTIFKQVETVQAVLEDAFGIQPGSEPEVITFPHQEEAALIMVRCLLHSESESGAALNSLAFLQLFSSETYDRVDHDRTLRIKSMIWMVYLLIDLVLTDRERVCLEESAYLRGRFRDLLDRALHDGIIDEDAPSPEGHFEGGRWDATLFGWLQGEEQEAFLGKLIRQFNFENLSEHANRLLLARHRECLFRQTALLFC